MNEQMFDKPRSFSGRGDVPGNEAGSSARVVVDF